MEVLFPVLVCRVIVGRGVCLYTDGSAVHACVDGMKELPTGLGHNYTEVK